MAPRNTESPPERLSGGAMLFLACILVLAVSVVVTQGAEPAPARQGEMPSNATNLLMLVREWDAGDGSLIGWLPIHRAAIHLEILDKLPAPHFDLNEPVNLVWLSRPGRNPEGGQLLVSPSPRTFEGERWLPVERDANLVRIGKRLFLIRRIVFGESRWRIPTRLVSAENASLGEAHGR